MSIVGLKGHIQLVLDFGLANGFKPITKYNIALQASAAHNPTADAIVKSPLPAARFSPH